MKLIDKDTLAAEIKKRRNMHFMCGGSPSSEYCYEDNKILGIIDTLEVKEVDLDEEITIAIPHRYSWSGDGSTMLYTEEQMKDFAKHFFELGLKAQK